ncbi:type IV pilus modification protein PilV [Endozoicomonas gorgoniicola]|uniref:Type IV pilus modification protein PilV n=1 Tax=Endozoicomonas gorgoniicola TaxID=1234144 RepID=A0ABT3MXY8_9GAMM|nr:type IV pilus modification protein PilV [Endozoicomonas gorgoniicola]MCW7554230.1 type IV pilus modification protein PilV [Endozoicomonas gorgoniicola]
MQLIRRTGRDRGFSLIEVLVALLVMALGITELSKLQNHSMQSTGESLHRNTAIMLASDLAERIKLNPDAALAGNYDSISLQGNKQKVIPSVSKDCSLVQCNDQELASSDMREWLENINDQQGWGADGSGYVPMLPGATASLTRNNRTFIISIFWQEANQSSHTNDRVSYRQRVFL